MVAFPLTGTVRRPPWGSRTSEQKALWRIAAEEGRSLDLTSVCSQTGAGHDSRRFLSFTWPGPLGGPRMTYLWDVYSVLVIALEVYQAFGCRDSLSSEEDGYS